MLVGAADGSVLARASQTWYLSLERPPGTPPNWLFASIWTVLYGMVGVAGWVAWRRALTPGPLRLWGWQLAANACWTPAFFALRSPPLALAVCFVLLVLIGLTVRVFWRIRRRAAWLMLPYWAWTGYVTYLTGCFWWLNPA